jgi:tripartite-type tricarboxylate transporter receptor subunit TctC
MVAHLRDFGAEPVGSTPEEFDAFVRRQLDVWADVVKRSAQAK